MIAYATYIISLDGRPLVSSKFQSAGSIPNDLLLSGLFTALQIVLSELTSVEAEFKTIKIENLNYHFKYFGYFRVVLVSNLQSFPKNVLHELGLRFMKLHSEKLLDLGIINEEDFKPFQNDISEIVRKEFSIDDSSSINPNLRLGTKTLFEIDNSIRPTILALLALEEGTVSQIARESKINENTTFENVCELQKMGLIGKKAINGESIYFIHTNY